MNVHSYITSSGKDLILEYIQSLSKLEIIDGLSVIKYFENCEFEKIRIKPWQGQIWEAYFFKHNRIFYVFYKGSDIYILHACRKQKNKTSKKDSDIIIKRAKELSSILKDRIL